MSDDIESTVIKGIKKRVLSFQYRWMKALMFSICQICKLFQNILMIAYLKKIFYCAIFSQEGLQARLYLMSFLWKCCSIYMDCRNSLSGCYTLCRIKWSHQINRSTCSLELLYSQKSLVAKPLPDSFKEVLNQSVEVVNLIKTNSTNSRPFKSLCKEVDNVHTTLLLQT